MFPSHLCVFGPTWYVYVYILKTVCLWGYPRKIFMLSLAGFVISPVGNLVQALTPENFLKFKIFRGESSSPHRGTETGCIYVSYIYYMYSFLLVLMLNIALSLLTTFTNIIIILFIYKNHRALNSPSISLYVYTAFADLLLGVVGVPLWISYQILAYYRKKICILDEILTFITHYFAIVSFFLCITIISWSLYCSF